MYEKIRDYQMITCPNCDGEGIILEGPTCFKPASSCCGGCYEELECPTCQGSRIIESNNEDITDTIIMIKSINHRIDKFRAVSLGFVGKEDEESKIERNSISNEIMRLAKLRTNLKGVLIEQIEELK